MRRNFWFRVAIDCVIVVIVFALWCRFVNPARILGQSATIIWACSAQTGTPQLELASWDQSTAHPTRQPDIERKVKAIIVEQLQVDEAQVTPNANFRRDLGADHLDMVELVMQFEQTFDINIPDKDAKKFVTVRDAIHYIEQHLKKTGIPQKHSHV